MTIPFRCATRHKKARKSFAPLHSIKIFVLKYSLRKQVHYRVRGGEWAQRKLNRIIMCTDCSFKHKFVGL